jgi:transposase-like protein
MSMPKGFKVERGYATVSSDSGGLGYREIAERMCEDGFKMNHSTARNIFISAMRKIAEDMVKLYDGDHDKGKVDDICIDPRFQLGVSEAMRDLEI